MAAMFAYIAGSPFLFIEQFGFSETQFAWFFGANAMGLIAVSQINGRIAGINPARPMMAGIGIQVLASADLLLAAISGWGLLGLIPPLFVFVAWNGLALLLALARGQSRRSSTPAEAAAG